MSDDHFNDIEELEQKIKELRPRLKADLKDPNFSGFNWEDLDEIERLLDKAENTPPPLKQRISKVIKDYLIYAGGLIVTFELIDWLHRIYQLIRTWITALSQ